MSREDAVAIVMSFAGGEAFYLKNLVVWNDYGDIMERRRTYGKSKTYMSDMGLVK